MCLDNVSLSTTHLHLANFSVHTRVQGSRFKLMMLSEGCWCYHNDPLICCGHSHSNSAYSRYTVARDLSWKLEKCGLCMDMMCE